MVQLYNDLRTLLLSGLDSQVNEINENKRVKILKKNKLYSVIWLLGRWAVVDK